MIGDPSTEFSNSTGASNEYIKESDGLFLLFDVSNLKSLNEIEKLIKILRESGNSVRFIICGMKNDLKSETNGKNIAEVYLYFLKKNSNFPGISCSIF